MEEPPRTIAATLARLGPGMIVAGSIVGSGELIATTKVGAEAGFTLLWVILLGCVIKVFTQVEFGRHTITWGESTLRALDSVPGPRVKVNWLVWYWAFMTLLIVSQQGGIVGGVGQALAIARPVTTAGAEYNRTQDAWQRARVDASLARTRSAPPAETAALEAREAALHGDLQDSEPPDTYIWATVVALLTSAILFFGRYGFVERFATLLVGSFTAVTVLTLVLLQSTDFAVTGANVVEGLRLGLPPVIEGANPVGTALAAFGIIGLGAGELIMYPYWCLEKGYARWAGPRDDSDGWARRARGWTRVLYTDAWFSLVVYTFATIAFYLLGAAVLQRIGLDPAGSDMVRTLAEMYVPVFGSWASVVFLFGAFTVLYSTYFVVAASFARILADALQIFGLTDGSAETRARWVRIFSTVWPIGALVVFLFIRAPVAMVLASGLAQAFMLPMLGVAALFFRYRRADARLLPSRLWDVMLWLSVLGFFLVAGWTIVQNVF